ncbi:hypothetical protein GN958_ATG16144 [Phytophthora infestans]|uniref:Uncharacterized protein n=1 Tax=Phytophthora infestans TaxID=4787 RepID=A0A8S9U4T6_PHYIN|nr:hypothetical protein GN958_ATG16144 [Phytophthora infestans]
MPAPTLPRGSYLLLFPEDVEGAIDTPAYAMVKRSCGDTATVILDGDNDDKEKLVNIPRTKALARKVDRSDAEGQRLGTWIRQAVCVKSDGRFRYGQVTGYSDNRLTICTLSGPIEGTRDAICDTVCPVVALVMGCHQLEEETLNYEQLTGIHDALMERLMSPPTSEAPQNALTLAQLMQSLLPDVSPGKPVPSHVKVSFGSSFCDSVGDSKATENVPAPNLGAAQTNPSNSSGFFDILRVDDNEEEAHEETLLAQTVLSGESDSSHPPRVTPRNRLQHPRQQSSRPHATTGDAFPANSHIATRLADASTAEEEIRALIRMHKPHLLPYHLSTQPNPDSSLKRPAAVDIDGSVTKRNKFSFHPSAEQRRVHETVTAEAHRGKSPSEFVESLVSSSDLWVYPGVATRAYDLNSEAAVFFIP